MESPSAVFGFGCLSALLASVFVFASVGFSESAVKASAGSGVVARPGSTVCRDSGR